MDNTYKEKTSYSPSKIDWAFSDPSKQLPKNKFTILKAQELIEKYKLNLQDETVENFAWTFLSDGLGGFLAGTYLLLERAPGQSDYKNILNNINLKAEKLEKKIKEAQELAKDLGNDLKTFYFYDQSHKMIPIEDRDLAKQIYLKLAPYQGAVKRIKEFSKSAIAKIGKLVKKKNTDPRQALDSFLFIALRQYETSTGKRAADNFKSRDNYYYGEFYDFCVDITNLFLQYHLLPDYPKLHRVIKGSINSSGFGKKIQKLITADRKGKLN